MTPNEVQLLYDYNVWANRRSLDAAGKLAPEQFLKHLGNSFSSVRDTLAHIYGAEVIWLDRFNGRSPSALPSANDFPDHTTLRAAWMDHEQRLLAFVRGLTQADLDRQMEYKTL